MRQPTHRTKHEQTDTVSFRADACPAQFHRFRTISLYKRSRSRRRRIQCQIVSVHPTHQSSTRRATTQSDGTPHFSPSQQLRRRLQLDLFVSREQRRRLARGCRRRRLPVALPPSTSILVTVEKPGNFQLVGSCVMPLGVKKSEFALANG